MICARMNTPDRAYFGGYEPRVPIEAMQRLEYPGHTLSRRLIR